MIEPVGLWWLLPLAIGIGWWWGRRDSGGRQRNRDSISSDYFRGLNYLLNEQPDKAIEVFLELADITPDTVETHLALGSLFRRRGETDKAIGFHRHIISRNRLTDEQRNQALLELAEDFYSAGLLDRAEKLFADLADSPRHAEFARRRLLALYEQEKDWKAALDQAAWLCAQTDVSYAVEMAQFQCELALEAMMNGDDGGARQWLSRARQAHPSSVRVDLIEGDLRAREGLEDSAAEAYRKALTADPELALLMGDRLIQTHSEDARDRLLTTLDALVETTDSLAPLMLWATVRAQQSPNVAVHRLRKALQSRPSIPGLELLLELEKRAADPQADDERALLAPLVRVLTRVQARYRCGHCGYDSQLWQWRCPSCLRWESVRPVSGVHGL